MRTGTEVGKALGPDGCCALKDPLFNKPKPNAPLSSQQSKFRLVAAHPAILDDPIGWRRTEAGAARCCDRRHVPSRLIQRCCYHAFQRGRRPCYRRRAEYADTAHAQGWPRQDDRGRSQSCNIQVECKGARRTTEPSSQVARKSMPYRVRSCCLSRPDGGQGRRPAGARHGHQRTTGRHHPGVRGAAHSRATGVRIGVADKVREQLERTGNFPAYLRQKVPKGSQELDALSLYQGPRQIDPVTQQVKPDQLRQFLTREEEMQKTSKAAGGAVVHSGKPCCITSAPGGAELVGAIGSVAHGNPCGLVKSLGSVSCARARARHAERQKA